MTSPSAADPSLSDLLGSVAFMLIGSGCVRCGHPDGVLCNRCIGLLHPPRSAPCPIGLATVDGLVSYEGTGREIILGLKYHNQRVALTRIARAMAALVRHLDIDTVTWPPTSTVRRRARGYDQAELLARAVARSLHVPTRRLLERGSQRSQTGLGRADRLVGPRFRACGRAVPSVLIVDDVVTTGSTLQAAATALRDHGVGTVHAVVVGVTPDARISLKVTKTRAEEASEGVVGPRDKDGTRHATD